MRSGDITQIISRLLPVRRAASFGRFLLLSVLLIGSLAAGAALSAHWIDPLAGAPAPSAAEQAADDEPGAVTLDVAVLLPAGGPGPGC